MTNYLLAGGGTAGHVNPLLALADAIVADSTANKVYALGTAEGLESRLVPAKGFELLTIARLPFPRKLNASAFKFPFAFYRAVANVESYISQYKIDMVVGFGGYASAPAYVAARNMKIPYVVHEANALAGWANKFGAKQAAAVATVFSATKLPRAQLIGMPLRAEISALAKSKDPAQARRHFGLDASTVTLLVTGGSLGAKRINDTIEESRNILSAAGIQVLHLVGQRAGLPDLHEKDYVRLAYCDDMAKAIEAATFAVARAGSSTVSEFAAVGLPAVYIPYPVGNGEQRLNAIELVEAGGGLLVADENFTPGYVANDLIPLISNSAAVRSMAVAAAKHGIADATSRLLNLVKGVL